MGFSRKRVGKGGQIRYTATYVDLRGSIRSAGTFGSEKAADRAWQKAEVELRQGRVGDPARGRQTFQKYVAERWLPNHVLEPTTREKYTYYLGAFIFPALGPMRMADIFPEHIREWISRMQREGRSAWTIQYCKSSILSSIFTTALNDQVTYIHPCQGVKIPTVPATPRTIITPEQFDAIYTALPDADTQLLVETAIESGLRWGELTELRVRDLDTTTRMLTVSRKVIEVNREFHPDGKRFLVKAYPKDKRTRSTGGSSSARRSWRSSRHISKPVRSARTHFSSCGGRLPRHRSAFWLSLMPPGSPSPTRLAASTGTAHSPPTTPESATARTAAGPTRTTAPLAVPQMGLLLGRSGQETGTSTSGATGSGAWSGARPAKPLAWPIPRVFMISGIHMRRGCSPVEPTCRS